MTPKYFEKCSGKHNGAMEINAYESIKENQPVEKDHFYFCRDLDNPDHIIVPVHAL